MHCTPRHLSRIFQELIGTSFRQKQMELRLSRAIELLSTTDSKVVDVAFGSGYRSLSLFNQLFKRRYGVSPARWREQLTSRKRPSRRGRPLLVALGGRRNRFG
jgi:iron complex transport system substrate-binding protein